MRPSFSANATKQFLKSPGAIIWKSSRNRPEEPPSSATVTIAVKFVVFLFNPRRSIDNPVPPPMTTILGP